MSFATLTLGFLVFASRSVARATRTLRMKDPEPLYTPMIHDLFLLMSSSGTRSPPDEDELKRPGLPFDARRVLFFSKGMLLSPLDSNVSSKALNVLLAHTTSAFRRAEEGR